VGMTQGFELSETKSLGLQLIPLLAEQFGGELNVKQDNGTRYDLRFRLTA
jgi:two-component sensor histidine kinase